MGTVDPARGVLADIKRVARARVPSVDSDGVNEEDATPEVGHGDPDHGGDIEALRRTAQEVGDDDQVGLRRKWWVRRARWILHVAAASSRRLLRLPEFGSDATAAATTDADHEKDGLRGEGDTEHRAQVDADQEDLRGAWVPGTSTILFLSGAAATCVGLHISGMPLMSAAGQRRAALRMGCVLAAAAGGLVAAWPRRVHHGDLHEGAAEQLAWRPSVAWARDLLYDAGAATFSLSLYFGASPTFHVLRAFVPTSTDFALLVAGAGALLAHLARPRQVLHADHNNGAAQTLPDDDDDDAAQFDG